jgi:hypothetical protein
VFKLHELPDDWQDAPAPSEEWNRWPVLPHRYKVPARSDVHGRKGIFLLLYFVSLPVLFLLSPVFKLARRLLGALERAFSRPRAKRANKEALLGYIPIELFLTLCVATFGFYPYVWLWNNSKALIGLCGRWIYEKRLRGFAAAGFFLQLLMMVSIAFYAASRLIGSSQFFDYAFRCSVVYIILYSFLIFPQRCYYYFELRWNIRRAVGLWDRDAVMIDRTMTSWLKLLLFGSAYIQLHANRLIGLGMPGFAGQDEILPEFSVRRWVKEYVIIKKRSVGVMSDLREDADG